MKVIFNYATRQFEPMEPSMRERFSLGTDATSFMSPNMQYKLTGQSDEFRIQPPLGRAVPLGGVLLKKKLERVRVKK